MLNVSFHTRSTKATATLQITRLLIPATHRIRRPHLTLPLEVINNTHPPHPTTTTRIKTHPHMQPRIPTSTIRVRIQTTIRGIGNRGLNSIRINGRPHRGISSTCIIHFPFLGLQRIYMSATTGVVGIQTSHSGCWIFSAPLFFAFAFTSSPPPPYRLSS